MDFAFVVSEKIEAGLDLVFNDLSVCFLVMFFYKIAKKRIGLFVLLLMLASLQDDMLKEIVLTLLIK